jgi:hypothetical protein
MSVSTGTGASSCRLQGILSHVQQVRASGGPAEQHRPRVAAIVTTCFPRSHGDVILTKLIKGMSLDEGFTAPRVDIVSLWIDCIAATSPYARVLHSHRPAA